LIEILVDFALMCGSFFAAYYVVVGGLGDDLERAAFIGSLPIVLGTRYLCFVLGGMYRRVWRYATATDELVIVVACVVSGFLAWFIAVALRGSIAFPSSVFALDAVFAIVLVSGARLGFRSLVEWQDGRRVQTTPSRVLIVGAGRLGRSFAQEVRETPGRGVVGFLDDNPALRGRRIAGQRVLGALSEANRVLQQSAATEVVVTIADAPQDRLGDLNKACTNAGVSCTIMHRRMERWEPPVGPTEIAAE
jgi:FlaA1/EpsC-like NDP-sugar epimerase